MDSGVDWSNLPTDLLGEIARCLPTIEDGMAFKGVCTGWRSAVFLTVSRLPVLMLPAKPRSSEREFYSLSKRRICTRKHLPEAKNKRSIDVGFGWVLTLSTKGCVFLSKPFSTAPRIELPSYKKFPDYGRTCYNGGKDWKPLNIFYIRKGMLTANPSETSNFKLLIITLKGVGIWKNGDDSWTRLCAQRPQDMVLRADGKMYKLVCSLEDGRYEHMEIWDPQATDFSKPQAIVKLRDAPTENNKWFHYLVESTDGELLLIGRNNAGRFDGYFEKGANRFTVMRLDLVKGECQKMKGLGKDAVFVGDNVSVAVDAAEFPGVLKPNCIYFTDDRFEAYMHKQMCADRGVDGGGKDMGIYNVEDEYSEVCHRIPL